MHWRGIVGAIGTNRERFPLRPAALAPARQQKVLVPVALHRVSAAEPEQLPHTHAGVGQQPDDELVALRSGRVHQLLNLLAA